MGRKLKYPEIEQLKVGQALFIAADRIDNLPTLRASVKGIADRRRINLSVHDRGEQIEIARYPSTADEQTEAVVRHCSMRMQFDEHHMRRAWDAFILDYIADNLPED